MARKNEPAIPYYQARYASDVAREKYDNAVMLLYQVIKSIADNPESAPKVADLLREKIKAFESAAMGEYHD